MSSPASNKTMMHKSIFFGFWSIFFVPFTFSKFFLTDGFLSFCLIADAIAVEFYVLFRLAQSLQSSSLCTGGASAATDATNGSSGNEQCPITSFLNKTDDVLHNRASGQFLIFVLSVLNIFLYATVSIVFLFDLDDNKLLGLLGLIGAFSFVPYLAFRAVMAIGYMTRPYSPSQRIEIGLGSDEEEGRLVGSEQEAKL